MDLADRSVSISVISSLHPQQVLVGVRYTVMLCARSRFPPLLLSYSIMRYHQIAKLRESFTFNVMGELTPNAGVLKLLPNWGCGSGTTGFQNFRNAWQLPLPLSSFCFHSEPHVMGGPTPNAEVSPPNWGCGITHAFKVSGTLDNFSFRRPIFIPAANSIFWFSRVSLCMLKFSFFSKGRSTIHVWNRRCHQLNTSRSLCDFSYVGLHFAPRIVDIYDEA